MQPLATYCSFVTLLQFDLMTIQEDYERIAEGQEQGRSYIDSKFKGGGGHLPSLLDASYGPAS